MGIRVTFNMLMEMLMIMMEDSTGDDDRVMKNRKLRSVRENEGELTED